LHGYNNATVDHPPENIVFHDLFYNNKKPRRSYHQDVSQASSSRAEAPQVHVHNHFSGMEPNSRVFSQRNNLSNCNTGTSEVPIIIDDASTPTLHIPSTSIGSATMHHSNRYPTLESILAAIDAEGSFEALIDFPVVIFSDNLREWGLVTVDDLTAVDPDFLTSPDIGMTQGLRDRVFQLASEGRKATKGKGKNN
jgi:hypothetical protein